MGYIDSIQQDTFSMLATLPDRPGGAAIQPPTLQPFPNAMHEGNGSATPPSLDGAPASHDDPTLQADTPDPLAPSGAEKQECLKEAVQRLAGLPKLEYEVIRKTEAIRLDVRPSFLDHAVEAARSDEDQEPPDEMFPDVEPWDEPVDANQLLDEVHATIRNFIVCDKAASITATLWIAFTWFIDCVQVAPIAIITAPQKRCGKSQLLDIMAKISCRPLVASSITPAALFRVIEGHKPTLFIDEADSFLKENEMLRGIINSGHTRQSAFVLRTAGEDFEPKRFSTWGAKVLCGIGKLPSTIMDRAVVLELRRKLKDERILRLRHSDPAHFRILARKLARLAEDRGDEIMHARPELPEALNDRAQDNWEPLLAIADLAGGTWPQTARSIAVFSAGEDEDVETSTLLLLDIQSAFNGMQTSERILGKDVKRMTTQILLGKLCADDTRPWATFDRSGGKMTPRQLSDQLKAFGIKPVSLKFQGDVVQRGYRLDQFEDTFTRYLTPLSVPGGPEEDRAPTIPNQSHYAATSQEPCGFTGSGLVAAEVTDTQPFGDGASEGAPEAATRNPSATPKSAPGLASSGVAAGMGGNSATAAEPFFEGEIE